MQIINVTEARSNLFNLIDQASITHEPIIIRGKRNNAVLISESDWSAINETLYLMSVKGMRESIVDGMSEDLSDCSEEPGW